MALTARPERSRPRTLTEVVRALDAAELSELIRLRPDLAYPVPRDAADLATRAATPTSVARAIEALDAWRRLVAEALAALPDPATIDDVALLLQAEPANVTDAVAGLRRRALVWGLDDLHLVRGARDHFEPYPGGLAPPSPRPLGSEEITTALAACDAAVEPVLQRLLWSPAGVVRNAERAVDPATARSPVDQLLARRLLRPLDADTVLLPREVAWQLREGRFTQEPVSPRPPAVRGEPKPTSLVDTAAVGAANGLLGDLELLAQRLESTPHHLLRDGSLAIRDAAQLARNLHSDLRHTVFVVECAAAAGLVSAGPGKVLLPTVGYDRWAEASAAERWRTVTAAWLQADRLFSRSAEAGAHALGPGAELGHAREVRRLVLAELAALEPGTAVELSDLGAALAWRRPRLAARQHELTELAGQVLIEAGRLGLTGLGATSALLPAAVTGRPLPEELAGMFPADVDMIIIQADLTAVAPGPLPHSLATELRLLADQESRGGAGVFRFSAASVRRALDAGWSVGDARRWLETHSSTGIPQPLDYLLADAARRHGSIRVGSAPAYVRLDDPAQTAALLAHPDADGLGLREVGPGVLVSAAEPDELVGFLQGLGLSPAAEDARGGTVSAPRAPRAPRPSLRPRAPQPDAAEVAAAVIEAEQSREAARAGEQHLDLLRSATARSWPVEVVWVGADGERRQHQVAPLDMAGGVLRAVDMAGAEVKRIPLARVLSVSTRPGVPLD